MFGFCCFSGVWGFWGVGFVVLFFWGEGFFLLFYLFLFVCFSKSFDLGKNRELCAVFHFRDLNFLRENNSEILVDNRLMFNSSEKSPFF